MATTKVRRGVSFPCDGSSGRTMPIGTRRSPSPSSSEKQLPNYLRPTVSSRGEPPKEVKKKAPPSPPHNAAKKPVLARRSSLDRPPVASHVQKIISSSLGERSVTVRSSSFSGRLGTSYRLVSEKASVATPLRTTKAVSRTHPGNNFRVKSVARKCSLTTLSSSSLAAQKKWESGDDVGGNDHSGMSSASESEDAATAVLESEAAIEDHHHHVAHPENDFAIKEEVAAEDIVLSAAEKDDKNSTASAPPQPEEVKGEEEIVSDQSKGKEKEAEVPEMEDEPVLENAGIFAKVEKEAGDAVEMVSNLEVGKISEGEKRSKAKEGEEEEERAAAKPRSEKPVVVAVTPARKDPAQANNDVIEETAKKLMESRKNKVRALAGAFETVISLEKPDQA